MDRDQLLDEIYDEIDEFSSNKKRELIELFISVMQIKIDASELAGVVDRQFSAYMRLFDQETSIAETKNCLSDALRIEPFLKKILYLVDENKYINIQKSNQGLSEVIFELGLNPQRKDLNSKPEKYSNDNNFMILLKAYQLRNVESHTYESWNRKAIYMNVGYIIISCLNAIDKNIAVIRERLKNEIIKENTIDVEDYLKELISQFKQKMSRFIHIRGEENYSVLGSYVVENQDEKSELKRRSGTVESLRDNEVPERRMMIWGGAGLGKSTTLEYLAYVDAKKRLKNEKENIPILILLGILTNPNFSIKDYICEKLKISKDICEMLLSEGKINLFIDGLNEIPNDAGGSLKTIRLREIKSFIEKYPKIFIIITNRPQGSRDFSNVPIFNLIKLSTNEINDFIEKNVDETEVKSLLHSSIDGNERFIQIINTPLILSRLIEIVKYKKEIPQSEGEIISEFLDCLFQREKEEKQDAKLDIQRMTYLLRRIAYESLERKQTNSGMKESEIMSYCKKSMDEYHFEYDALYAVDMATQLGILEKKEDVYVFSHQVYQDHYYAIEELAIIES